jgi:hypothetical protein
VPEQLQQVAEFADTIPEDSMDRSFSFANITSSLRFRRMGEGREEAARKITGARWSGPRFFGLRRRQLELLLKRKSGPWPG